MSAGFWVSGKAVPKGSTKSFLSASTHRMVTMSMGKDLKPWTHAVATRARAHLRGDMPLDGPVWVSLNFVLPLPKVERVARWHHVRPDIDKITRAVLDGLTGVSFGDDGQVARLTVEKIAGADPGVFIQVRPLLPLDGWVEIEEALR